MTSYAEIQAALADRAGLRSPGDVADRSQPNLNAIQDVYLCDDVTVA